MEHPPKRSKPPTSFLDLPPELRNQVYESSLPELKNIYLRLRRVGKETPGSLTDGEDVFMEEVNVGDAFQVATSLSRASRQLHAEIAPVLYGRYKFSFLGPRAALRWSRSIGASLVHLRKVEIIDFIFVHACKEP
ncbi:hypothetical protein Slin15195_G122600 [Septoria linicola]|uniref:DUF7730 domain-containing protein n=1 Tax=Septoria linicola TaxID=215465 RepID=A0A9Q9B8D4_9PEZI|nr:hypothetical protein Slin14017_G078800 [Septoria linicola]USW58941.1 hypothetical protein Slin15195_G122600 [Septoria linicola]